MKHVEVQRGGTDPRFRVWCGQTNKYVLLDATAADVESYFVGISLRRARAAAHGLIHDAMACGATPQRIAYLQ